MNILGSKTIRILGFCLLFLILSFQSWKLHGSSKIKLNKSTIPPVGQRSYHIQATGNARFKPVEVRKESEPSSAASQVGTRQSSSRTDEAGRFVFRDPVLIRKEEITEHSGPNGNPEPKKGRTVAVKAGSVYHLKTLKIKGAWHKPRVPFHEIKMKTKRVIDPIQGHFIDKIEKNLPDLTTAPSK